MGKSRAPPQTTSQWLAKMANGRAIKWHFITVSLTACHYVSPLYSIAICYDVKPFAIYLLDNHSEIGCTHYMFLTSRPLSTLTRITCVCTRRIAQRSRVQSFLYFSPTSAPTLQLKKVLSDPLYNLFSCFF